MELEGQRGAWSTWTKRYDCHSVFQVDIGLDDIKRTVCTVLSADPYLFSPSKCRCFCQ